MKFNLNDYLRFSRQCFRVIHDPCDDPFLPNLTMNRLEVYYGLRFGSFVVGTVIEDLLSGTHHTVVLRKDGRFALTPPNPKITARAVLESLQST